MLTYQSTSERYHVHHDPEWWGLGLGTRAQVLKSHDFSKAAPRWCSHWPEVNICRVSATNVRVRVRVRVRDRDRD